MTYDRNPAFGADQNYVNTAQRVTDLLWETTRGDLSRIPFSYLESLNYEYSDGYQSLLPLLGKVQLSDEPTYEEFSEVVSSLMKGDVEEWPEYESIVSIPSGKLLYEIEPEFDFSESDWDFVSPEDMSDKMELFLKKVIASVYTDGVTSVTDKDGNPPNAQNNYLLSEDGKTFSGMFHDVAPGEKEKHFSFEIKEGKSGAWQIQY